MGRSWWRFVAVAPLKQLVLVGFIVLMAADLGQTSLEPVPRPGAASRSGEGVGASNSERKNVLYLIVDDLRPQMTSYNQTFMKTPNLQRLAERSLVFERAYCQVAVCVASRNSFLTGRRPDVTKVWSGMAKSFRDTGPDWVSLPEHFKTNGFTTLGGGKTYHPGSPPNFDEPKSWSQDVPYFPFKASKCPNRTRSKEAGGRASKDEPAGQVTASDTWCPLDETDYPHSYHYDNQLANHTASLLRLVQKESKPFFIAAGFRRPHVPWMMPRQFWDMYADETDVPAPMHVRRPLNSPDIAFHNQGVFNLSDGAKYTPMPTPFPVDVQQAARRAYFASVSWTDYNIGLVLDELDRLGLSDNTMIVVHGDHGFQLGEHDSWHKQTNWELATRVPLMVSVPWLPKSMGKRTYALVELVDMYRTVADLVDAARPAPGPDINGTSLAYLFAYPETAPATFAKLVGKPADAAFSQYLRCVNNVTAQWADNWCSSKDVDLLMGYSMRSAQWRYTAWMKWQRETSGSHREQVDWSEPPAHVELYDHSGEPWQENDFNLYENENVASAHDDVVTAMQAQLKQFFEGK